MKAYLLYVGDHYYPCRCVGDLVGDFDTVAECKEAAASHGGDWAVIVQHADMTEVVDADIADEDRWRYAGRGATVKWVWAS